MKRIQGCLFHLHQSVRKYLMAVTTILLMLDSSAQTLKQGDNLRVEYTRMNSRYFFKAPPFTPWKEGQDMLVIGAKPKPLDCDYLFLALKDTTLIGIFVAKEPSYFMFDTSGNSILSSRSDFFLLPLWVVKRKTKVTSADKTIVSVLDRLYETTLQADDLQTDAEAAKKYQQYQTDTTLANRHIALLFDEYQTIVTETTTQGQNSPADICVPLMKSLADECVSLYNKIPVIVCIYMGEALQSAGMINEARNHFKMCLQLYPTSIPLLVYNYQLEQDPDRKKKELEDLKKKYPKHWMVKDL